MAAYDSNGQPREGAQVAELTHLLTHLTDLAQLAVTHRLRARAEDRIRGLKDSGLRNLPLHDFAQNQVWLETVLLAADLLAWTATLGLTAHRKTEPKPLRLRLLHVAARVVRSGRTTLSSSRPTGPGPTRSSPPTRGCVRCRPQPEHHPTPRPGNRRTGETQRRRPPTPYALTTLTTIPETAVPDSTKITKIGG